MSDSLTPAVSPERREQIKAFEELFWKGGEAVSVHGPSWYAISLAAWLMACDHANSWRSVAVDGLPASCVPVLAFFINEYGKARRIRAEYAGLHSLALDSDSEGGCECDDCATTGDYSWCAPGWYESNEYEEVHWRVPDVVTHWMPLPEAPA